YDPAARRLYGVPVAVSVSEAIGTAHVLAEQSVILNTDSQGLAIQWSENSNATDFSQNLIRCRCEGRYATSVPRPLGVVQAIVGGGSGWQMQLCHNATVDRSSRRCGCSGSPPPRRATLDGFGRQTRCAQHTLYVRPLCGGAIASHDGSSA